jgi:hypothetical protein
MHCVRGWILDYLSPQTLRYRKKHSAGALHNAPFKFEPTDWVGFFEQHGWRPKVKRFLGEEGVRLGRPAPLPPLARVLWKIRGLFMSRKRREGLSMFAGYFLMEPI